MNEPNNGVWRGRTEATLESISGQIASLRGEIEAAVARGIQSCPGGIDREARLRVLEHAVNGHLAVDNRTERNTISFWLPLAYSVIGGAIVAAITSWMLMK